MTRCRTVRTSEFPWGGDRFARQVVCFRVKTSRRGVDGSRELGRTYKPVGCSLRAYRQAWRPGWHRTVRAVVAGEMVVNSGCWEIFTPPMMRQRAVHAREGKPEPAGWRHVRRRRGRSLPGSHRVREPWSCLNRSFGHALVPDLVVGVTIWILPAGAERGRPEASPRGRIQAVLERTRSGFRWNSGPRLDKAGCGRCWWCPDRPEGGAVITISTSAIASAVEYEAQEHA